MNNTSIKYGRAAKSRILFMAGAVQCLIVAPQTDWVSGETYIERNQSWQERNRGKQSKQQRRS